MQVFTIKNDILSVSVNSFGAELCSVRNKNNVEFIWQADKAVWPRHAPILFPIVGKLKGNKYSFTEKEYNLPQHGFARDKTFILVEETENCLEFELTSDHETLLNYPFHFSLRIRYEVIENRVNVRYIVFNPNNFILPFSIGAHPGFNCKTIAGESLNDFYLEFSKKTEVIAQKLEDGLLSGATYPIVVKNGQLKLSTGLFVNDALVFKNTQIEEVALCSEKSALKIKLICAAWPYFGIWTKKGSDAFVCLEPWHGITDNSNSNGSILEKSGIVKLKPYQSFEAEYSLDFR